MLCEKSRIRGIDKILELEPDFRWNAVKELVSIKFDLAENEFFEQIAVLEIIFSVACSAGNDVEMKVKFVNVTDVSFKNLGKCNQILGFEIVENNDRGWEECCRYQVNDYENSILRFYCEKIEVVDVL